MHYKLLNAGDQVLSVTDELLAVERNNGTVELYPLSQKDNTICINLQSSTVIDYIHEEDDAGDEFITNEGVHIVNF